MLKRTLSYVLIVSIVIATGSSSALAADANAKEAAFVEKVKASIVKLGTGPSAQVEIKLRDKNKLKGYIKESNEERFSMVDAKTGVTTEIAYAQVKQVKGNNLSTGAKVAIGVGVAFVILLVVLKDRIEAH